ncbi:hypothetical protein Tco_0955563 [Tanacetum coccineum]|uniref:Uncharacterized protein n=1 Tax=Tanacetum coccineum TaxID=301880 RepID=A0ABQ5E7J7_9ASTR
MKASSEMAHIARVVGITFKAVKLLVRHVMTSELDSPETSYISRSTCTRTIYTIAEYDRPNIPVGQHAFDSEEYPSEHWDSDLQRDINDTAATPMPVEAEPARIEESEPFEQEESEPKEQEELGHEVSSHQTATPPPPPATVIPPRTQPSLYRQQIARIRVADLL